MRRRIDSFICPNLRDPLLIHPPFARFSDKDFRYMATSDLLTELQKESFKPDSDGEKKICKAVLKLINDQSSDVQGLAVKWCTAAAISTRLRDMPMCTSSFL